MSNALNSDHLDGIQVSDNPLPDWWKWTYLGTIFISICYAMYFHIGAPGRSLSERFDSALSTNMRLQFAEIGDLTADADTLVKYTAEPSWLKVGQAVYKTNCVSCHGRDGEGKVGPNLTDDFYKNVSKIEDIARVITKGAGNGAMPAWADRLHANEVVLVSSYVASLRGKKPPGDAKGPDGNQIPAWPTPTAESRAPQVPTKE